MTDVFRDLYEQLLNGIKEIEESSKDRGKQIEAAFHLSENIRRQAEAHANTKTFETPEAKVFFLKKIKPRFSTLVEFYSILYRAELFIPDATPDRREFWNFELQRAQLFLMRHADLLQYLNSSDTSFDEQYFLHAPADSRAATDELIAKLFAREKYIEYITHRILPQLNP